MNRLLVANRGEIARRIIRSCRDLGISPVAVYSDPDADAPHVAEADLAVRLPGAAPADTYLRIDLLVAAARRAGADAVHPGYGFLAENAGFATAVLAAGLVWVGPPRAAIAAMGSKVEAKRLMAAAGVPVLPTWPAGAVPADARYPVLVKASYGGGGRGMRIVPTAAALAAATGAAGREAAAAFGDGAVFVEPYLAPARHIEVQVLADPAGTVVALGERECSIQRRHQKIIEEAPSPAVSGDLRARLFDAAVAAARAIGYVGAGTVEFLLGPAGELAFLEMNTRLQVEHPVTECVLGLDLVALQLRIAEGAPLPFTEPPPVTGHAIEARLYAEDPAAGWRPSTGTLHGFEVPGTAAEFAVPAGYGLRVDSGVRAGSVVSGHYDAMLAKLIGWAPTRAEAARRLAGALAGARLHGITTNRDLLVRVLRQPDFLAGDTDTGFLDRHSDMFAPLAGVAETGRCALAAALARAAERRADARILRTLPAGWRNVRSQPAVARFDGPAGEVEVTYRPLPAGVRVLIAEPARVALEIDGLRREYRVSRVGDTSYVDGPEAAVTLRTVDPLPAPAARLQAGSLIAPMPGTVLRLAVAVGDRVAAGAPLLALEAMKMEHAITAPAAGTVTALPVGTGSQVDAGAVLVVLEPDEPEA
ncbi:MAG TPA: biotin carboxylase N-terminal domain-containing protein [Mycobacteriales bacterium]|nr:biotin carboxylase N-terminal domain-containing protein [Mycobacteriales bacterium]